MSGPLQLSTVGVLLMTFGTAATLDDVPSYLANVRGGYPAPDDLVVEFKRRFALVGGSPLTRITHEQAAALEVVLNRTEPENGPNLMRHLSRRRPLPPTQGLPGKGGGDTTPSASGGKGRDASGFPGPPYIVDVGMRHAPPFISEGIDRLASAGARRILAIVLSPQFSPMIMGGYLRAIDSAREALGPDVEVAVAGPWHDEPRFLEALAERVRAALEAAPAEERNQIPVLFTAHSLPRPVADGEPGYLQQLRDTADAVAERSGLAANRWRFVYQSAGHTRDEWLKPDLLDVLPEMAAAGHRSVLVAPVQFLADHLEVLYDVDIAAREQAEAAGISLTRIESLNTTPRFIDALAAVVRRELES